MTKSDERTFQKEIIDSMLDNGWLLGKSNKYNRKTALYEEDLLGFVQESQPEEWAKYGRSHPKDREKRLINAVVKRLEKSNPNTSDLRRFGTLGILRKKINDTPCSFTLCQFKPEHNLNPKTLERYNQNRLRVVGELVYSPYATEEHLKKTGTKAKAYRIDLVLFINGLPIITLELKSEFKQSVNKAVKQYKKTRLPKDPTTGKTEPLLTFKRGALVHFAVSQYEVFMCTKLSGTESFFLPFNRGCKDGGKGNDIPEDPNRYATDYLWNEVLLPDNILRIISDFIHLEIKKKQDANGLKNKEETLIFPRYHQWDVVKKLIEATGREGAGHRYLIQHSAGSGKSNSIAWTAHQLSALYDAGGNKQFDSVIIVTDRTILDAQLQDTISQFTDIDGVVGRINHKEGQGSKSEKLAKALESCQRIIIVTIQTFKYVLDWIEKNSKLRQNRFAVIADEAHSSQSGSTAKGMKGILSKKIEYEDSDEEEKINELAKRNSPNISYFAFTATPKDKTLQLFGRCPDLDSPPSKNNLPAAFHVYSMRQAIEEGFILDVLKNYITYKAAYNLALKAREGDREVDSKKARTKLNQWVILHEHNISQKVKVIVEHFKTNVKECLCGQAKAMIVTSSRKTVVRYKLALDKYLKEQGYSDIAAIVAFSGEVRDSDISYTESNMNPHLKGRDMCKAFDSEDYQLMLAADKFQTGFDQPKLCAMYVDKKLGGVECVQTLSRLNRYYPGKKETGTFVLDFYNNSEDILEAFLPYYKTAELADVSDPDLVYDLFDKLKAEEIYQWTEVEQFYKAFLTKGKSAAAISNICKPAVERWQNRYKKANTHFKKRKEIFERMRKLSTDTVLITNAETEMKNSRIEFDSLVMFKRDLGSFTRFYEFMSQIIDYEKKELDELSLFARHLHPLLREKEEDEDDINLGSVILTHYRLSKIREENLVLDNRGDYRIEAGSELGTGKAKNGEELFLSAIIDRLNELFNTDELTPKDMINYACGVRDKILENKKVMAQIKNNIGKQILLGDYPAAVCNAVMESSAAHNNQMRQCLSNKKILKGLELILLDMIQHNCEDEIR